MKTDFKRWIDTYFDTHLALLKRLAAIPAPSHNEDKRVAFLLDQLKNEGVEAYADPAKNVLVPMGCGGGDGITLISAHTDVVFPDTEPLPVCERDGKLFAPGVGDDTANLAAVLAIISYIKQHGLTPERPLLFALNSCEEGLGNLKGIKQITADFAGRIARHISFDCAFEEGMIVKAVGSERWRVACKTAGGHSFNAFGSANAIHRMAKLIDSLYEQEIPDIPDTKTTYNAGMITGGTSINTIAQSCEMLYEYRSDDKTALSAMRQSFIKLLDEAKTEDAEFSAEPIGQRPCGGAVDEWAMQKLIGVCSKAYRSVTGREQYLTMGSTDANVTLSLGIPALTFGLYSGAGAHTREEWLDIASLKPGLEIGLKTVFDLCF